VVEINTQAVQNNLPDLSLSYNLLWSLQLWYEMKESYVTRFFSLQNTEENDALEDGHVCLSVRSLVWVCVRLCVNARTYSDKI
jgi:hypothetical protein